MVSVVDDFLIAPNNNACGIWVLGIQVFLGNHLIDIFAGPFCVCVFASLHIIHRTVRGLITRTILFYAQHVMWQT
jgi:hypothetical protein